MEKELYEVIQRKKANLAEEEKRNNGKSNKDFGSGMSYSDIGEIAHISQMKMEYQSSAYEAKVKNEEGNKAVKITEALDGICPCCQKNQISKELIKKPINLPICEECGIKCVDIRIKNNLTVLDYLNLIIKERNIKED